MIYLPPPQPVINSDIRISGDVEIHPTASLAPGVILQAAPGNKIVIEADVCIGMGSILNAGNGQIKVESGATLGSGVLIIGESKIGNNACIGTATTIFQASIASMVVINPGSIVGDISRQAQSHTESTSTQVSEVSNSANSSNLKSDQNFTPSNNGGIKNTHSQSTVNTNQSQVNSPHIRAKDTTKPAVDSEAEPSQKENNKTQDLVVGQTYINQLLVTLFPHKKNSDTNNTKTPPDL